MVGKTACSRILLLNGFKYGLGPEVGFPSFYLIPIALVSWFVSLRAGVITAVASALSLLSLNLPASTLRPAAAPSHTGTQQEIWASFL